MKKKYFIILVLDICISCFNMNGQISNSKWSLHIFENCVDSLYLSELDYKHFCCERQDTLFGSYNIKNDTLILNQKGSVYDKFAEYESEKIGRATYKLLIKGDTLIYFKGYGEYNSPFIFEKKIYFIKK